MRIYCAMVYCHDHAENDSGAIGPFGLYLNPEAAINRAREIAKLFTEDENREEGYYEGYTESFELIE